MERRKTKIFTPIEIKIEVAFNQKIKIMFLKKLINFSSEWGGAIIGGLVFLLVFNYGYSNINPDFYILRDDGIITLSHAKNLVEYGFIGVGPSGERVEGYSAPVQFFVYALAYFLFEIGFSSYAKAQTLFCTFAIGFLFSSFFKEKKYFAVVAAAVVAFLLTQLTSFLQWHGSGMENAITHSIFALTAYVLFDFARKGDVDLRWAVVPFLACISRLDGIYHIFPLLLVFSIYWYFVEKNKKGFCLLFVTMLLWVAYHLWRFFYFGELTPNTAYAQDISVGRRIYALLNLEGWALNSSVELSRAIFSAHGGYFLFLALPFLAVVDWKKPHGLLFVFALSIIATAWFNPFLFGSTRLDVTRTTTQMAFFVFVAVCCVIYSIKSSKALLLIPFLIPVGVFINKLNYVPSYDMCCKVSGFDSFRQEFAKLEADENLPRPTVSNPDLGIMSWYKQFNIVDLGMLGSPVVAKLKNGPVLAKYYLDYAAPDMIESHGAWSCRYYDSIFADPRFKEMYIPIKEREMRWAPCEGKVPSDGIWIRKDIKKVSVSAERRLVDDLLTNGLSIERLSNELAACQGKEKEKKACVYVARTAYRFLPEFLSSGKFDALVEVFQSSRTKEFDTFLLTGFRDGRANEKAIAFILNDFLINSGFSKIDGGNDFDVYINKRNVAYVNKKCSRSKVSPPIYLHIFPADADAGKVNDAGFLNMDFSFISDGIKINQECIAVKYLPSWNIKSVTTGQWLPAEGKEIWKVTLDLNR